MAEGEGGCRLRTSLSSAQHFLYSCKRGELINFKIYLTYSGSRETVHIRVTLAHFDCCKTSPEKMQDFTCWKTDTVKLY
jgi:hypothetical protein